MIDGMRKLFETVGFLLAVAGAAGIAQHYLGWFRFHAVLRFLPLGDADVLWVNIVLIVIGAILMITPDLVRGTQRR